MPKTHKLSEKWVRIIVLHSKWLSEVQIAKKNALVAQFKV